MTGMQYRLNYIGGISLDEHKIIYEQTDKVDANGIQSFYVVYVVNILKIKKSI